MAGISKKTYCTKKGTITKYVITYRDVFGKQHTSGSYLTLKEAKRDLYKFEKITVIDKDITIGKILDVYIESRKKKNKASNTIKDYLNCKKNHLYMFEDIKYLKLSPFDWQEFILNLSNKKSPFIAHSCYRFLRASFNYALKYKIISENPFKDVETVSLPKVKHNHFELNEILRLLEICKTEVKDFYVLLFMFVGSGMREGELFGLYKEDFDYKNRVINVCRQYTNYEQKETPKTSSSIRKVYLFPLLADLLKEYIDNDKLDTPLVFHNSIGNHLHPSNVRQRWWNKLLKLAGYKDYYARMHDLRGSNTDISFALGLSVSFAQEQLGHSSATTTLNKYARRNQQMIDDGMKKFEEAFTKKCEQNVSKNEQKTNSNIFDFSKYRRSKG